MINTKQPNKPANIISNFDTSKLLAINDNSIKTDYLESSQESITKWSKQVSNELFATLVKKLRSDSLLKIKQLSKEHKYDKLISLLAQPELFPIWQQLVSTKELAIIIANDLNVGLNNAGSIGQTDANVSSQVIATIIVNNFDTFFNALLASSKFKHNDFTLLQKIYILLWCNVYLITKKQDNESFLPPANLKVLLSQILPDVLQKKNYHHISTKNREFITEIEVDMHYHEVGLPCFILLAERGKLFDSDHTYDDMTFICRDKADFDSFINWAHSDNKLQYLKILLLIKDRVKQIKLGWYQRLVTKQINANNKELISLYLTLAECSK